MKIDISVLLPAHNEAMALKELLPELKYELEKTKYSFEVIVVDDGSQDDTPDVIKKFSEKWDKLILLQHSISKGQTEALYTGISHSKGSIVVIMDADGQNVPSDIPKMAGMLMERKELMMVAGKRILRKDPFFRKILSFIANRIIAFVSGTKIIDTGCALKAVRGDIIRSLYFIPDMHRYLPVILAMDGITYEVVEVQHRPRKYGKPHYGMERIGKVLLDIIALRFISRQARPYHILGVIGLFCIAVSLLLDIYVLLEKYKYGIWVHRNPLFIVAIVFFMTGLQITVLGILSEIMSITMARWKKSL